MAKSLLLAVTLLAGGALVHGGWGGYGDPHYEGFSGTQFDFHGYKGAHFAILSEPGHQLNAYFGDIAGQPDLTWMHAIGLTHGCDQVEVRLLLEADGMHGARIEVFANGRLLVPGESVTLPDNTIVAQQPNGALKGQWASIETETFHFEIEMPLDGATTPARNVWSPWLNIADVKLLKTDIPSGQMHGVLGQTYNAMLGSQLQSASSVEESPEAGKNPYQGSYADYQVSSLFSHDFAFDKYTGSLGGVKLQQARRLLASKPASASAKF